jgi:predicted NACHT family NTPase
MLDPTLPMVSEVFVGLLKSGLPHVLAISHEWLKAKGREVDLLNNAGRHYADGLERRYNFVKIIGMDTPIPLRDIYVRVNILNKISSTQSVSIAYLEKQFNLDHDGFGHIKDSWDGSTLLSRSAYVLNNNALAFLRKILLKENQHTDDANAIKNALDDIAGYSFIEAEPLLAFLSNRFTGASLKSIQHHESELLKISRKPTPNYIVLGKPGAGKTTFLKFLTLTALDGRPNVKMVPVFVGLKDYADSGKDFLSYVIEEFDICRFPEAAPFVKHLLERGRCVIMCDGLDEVPAEAQDRVIRALRDVSDKYFDCQFIISCRVAAYNHWFGRFVDLEIADFGPPQVETFVRNWFGHDANTATGCLEKINSRRQTRELATTPLLLTLLCLAYDQAMGFPSNRAELYREGVDALLKKWDASRRIRRDEIYKNLSIKRKETLLSEVAEVTFAAKEYFFKRPRLEDLVAKFIKNLPGVSEEEATTDAEAVVKAIEAQHGFLVERARGIYSFSHLTFQEYFTAKHIVDLHDSLDSLVEKYLKDVRWREVVLLVAGLLPQADPLFKIIKKVINRIERQLELSEPLRLMQELATQVHGTSAVQARCDLFVYWMHHARVMNSPSAEYFATAIQSICDVAGMLESGHILRQSSDSYIERASRAANKTDLPTMLGGNKVFWLVQTLRAKPGSPSSVKAAREFPIRDIARYADMQNLLYSCLVSDCYITKELRTSLSEFALTPFS